tara:strand:+ start:5356 stop:5892 length:537 start_codon:yes stop_codon:yes gene_type:complete
MACLLTTGRTEPCKDSVGGLTKVYFADFGDFAMTDITYASNSAEITDIANGSTIYQYDLKGTSTFEQTITSSRDNGTTFYDQVLTLSFKKLDKATHDEIALLATSRPKVFVEDNNGNVFVAGLEYGMDCNGGSIVTGAAMGDLSGYSLTLQGMEKKPANFYSATALASDFTIGSQINP